MQQIKSFKKSKKRSWTRRIFSLATITGVFCIAISYFSPYISPDINYIPAFFGISYPFILIINLILCIYWVFVNRKIFLLLLAVILIGFNHLSALFAVNFYKNEPNNTNAIKIMSYNVKNFDLYNYRKNWELNFDKRNEIFDYLNMQQPNIACFQEYYFDQTGKFVTTDSLKKFLHAKNDYFVASKTSRNVYHFGLAIFSQYEIIDTGRIDFASNSSNMAIYADLKIDNDTVRVYNVHFESIKLSYEDYLFADNLLTFDDKKNNKKGYKSQQILIRLKNGYIHRAKQARIMEEHIKASPYPAFLCGDFNDTPFSFTYHRIDNVLDDAFVASGWGTGKTYAGVFPSFRIDYIWYPKKFKSVYTKVDEVNLSDHYPVISYFIKR